MLNLLCSKAQLASDLTPEFWTAKGRLSVATMAVYLHKGKHEELVIQKVVNQKTTRKTSTATVKIRTNGNLKP